MEPKKKGKGGKPPKLYEDYVDDKILKFIKESKGKGVIDEEIYKAIGISRYVGARWKKEYPAFNEAFKQGKKSQLEVLEGVLFKRAKGYKYIETETFERRDKNGEIIETSEKKKNKLAWSDPNLQFMLKKLAPEKWGDNEDNTELTPEKVASYINGLPKAELEELMKHVKI